ncbi:MAG: hypothetical protein Q4C87_01465 [Actinomycetaceae bacterium]|nr:hypothetical protein [Actinomycetaceae bacterium]
MATAPRHNTRAISLLCACALVLTACSSILYGDNAPPPAPIVPGAAEAITPGVYEVPANTWLQEGYAEGIGESWTQSASEVLGVSPDGTTVVLAEPRASGKGRPEWVGRDLYTGDEKWRNSNESKKMLVEAMRPAQGPVIASDLGDKEDTLYSIDPDNGTTAKIGAYDTEKYYFESVLGYQHGLTYVKVSLQKSHGLDDGTGVFHIIAFKGGEQAWLIEAGRSPTCELADGAIVCHGSENRGQTGRIDIYNSATGERAAEIKGDYSEVAIYRDAIAVQDNSGGDAKIWSLQGKEKGAGPLVQPEYWPEVKYNYDVTKAIAEADAPLVDSEGKPLVVRKAPTDGAPSDSAVSTPVYFPKVDRHVETFFGSESGSVIIRQSREYGDNTNKTVFIDAEGKEGVEELPGLVGSGILYAQSGHLPSGSSSDVTIHPPKGR